MIGKSEHIKPRAFRAKISGLNEKPPSELALNSQTPGLRIRRAVAPVDRKRVRHFARRRGDKTAGEAERIRQAGVHIARNGEWRLLRELERQSVVSLPIIIGAVARSHDRGLFEVGHFPRQTHSWRKIVVIGVDESRGEPTGIRAASARRDPRNRRIAGRDVEICDAPVLLIKRREVFVAQSQVQRQIGPHFPVVLREPGPDVLPKVCARISEAD